MVPLASYKVARFNALLPPAIAFCVCLGASSCSSGDNSNDARHIVRVAVAANFAAAQEELARRFQANSGIEVETSLGSSGQLYAQIINGAPYDVFLSADVARPDRLEHDGQTVPGTRFTYAVGRLVLYAPGWGLTDSVEMKLRDRPFQHLAIADPRIAPYGVAARQVLERWGLWDGLQTRLVQGESVGQAFQFVDAGAAELGFVALSQVIARREREYWIVPRELHRPLRQDAVLLRTGEPNTGARGFLQFLKSEEGQRIIARFGYALP
jgi:molybdate transport system substrate-binding protein